VISVMAINPSLNSGGILDTNNSELIQCK
jgi:hypothetical protein